MQRKLAFSISALTGLRIVGTGVGIFSSIVLAYHFGAGKVADAFFLAQSIPLIFAKFLQVGPFTRVFLPLYSRQASMREAASSETRELAYNLFNGFSLGFLALSLLLVFFAPLLIRVMAPGFDSETRRLAAQLAILMIATLWLTFCDEFFTVVLHASNRFIEAACLELVAPLTLCGAVVFGAGRWGIMSAAYGVLIGSVLQAMGLYLLLARKGFAYRFYLNFRRPELLQMFKTLLPFSTVAISVQIQQIVFRVVASFIGPGTIAVFGYAEKFYHTLSNLFSVTIPTVLFPSFIQGVQQERLEEVRQLLRRGARLLNFFLLPIVIGIMVIREPLVRFLLERGSFGPAASEKTAVVLSLIMLGLLPVGVSNLLSRILFAFQKSELVILGSLLSQFITIGTHLAFGIPFGMGGLAFSYALNGYLLLCFYALFAKGRLPGGLLALLADSGQRRIAYAACLMGGICVWAMRVPVPLFMVMVIGVASYVLVSYLLRIEEIGAIGGFFRPRSFSVGGQRHG